MQSVKCPHCAAINSVERANCYLCEHSLDGEPDEPGSATAPEPAVVLTREDLQRELGHARRTAASVMLIVAVLNGIGATFLLLRGVSASRSFSFTNPDEFAALLAYAITGLCGLASLYAKRHPTTVTLLVFLAYVAIETFEILWEPRAFLSGALLRVLVLILLVRGLFAGAHYRELVQRTDSAAEDHPQETVD